MRLRIRVIIFAALAVTCLTAAPALAQEVIQLTGSVNVKDADGSLKPGEKISVDVWRTDIKSDKPKTTATDKNGRFVILLPYNATVTVAVYGPGLQSEFRTGIPVIRAGELKFELVPGPGHRPTMEEIMRTGGSAAPIRSEADAKAAAEAAAKAEEERKKLDEIRSKFDEKKAHFDAGIAASTNKDYNAAIAELTAALDGLDDADPKYFGELVEKSSSNLAEAHYQMGVDAYNAKNKDVAKDHLEKGSKLIARAISINPADPIYYTIQGKINLLLVDKFSETDKVDAGVAAYTKVAEMSTDPKEKVKAEIKAGDVYRAAYQVPQAVEAYKKVLVDDPDNVEAIYGIGLASMGSTETKDFQIAADYLKLFVDKAPNDPRTKDIKDLLASLLKDYKIKPRPIK